MRNIVRKNIEIKGCLKAILKEIIYFNNNKEDYIYRLDIIFNNPNRKLSIYTSKKRVGEYPLGTTLIIKINLINYYGIENLNNNIFPVFILNKIVSNKIDKKYKCKDEIELTKEYNLSNSNIKKIDKNIDNNINSSYLYKVVKDFDKYERIDEVDTKINNYLELLKKATYNKLIIYKYDDKSIDIKYKKEEKGKEIDIFSIIYDEPYYFIDINNEILLLESDEKYELYFMVEKSLKYRNIKIDKSIDLLTKYIELFIPDIESLTYNNHNIKEEFNLKYNEEIIEKNKIKSILSNKKILIISRDRYAQNVNEIHSLTSQYGYKNSNVIIENDNSKINRRGIDYIEKIKNHIYFAVIVGSVSHSNTGNIDTNNNFVNSIEEACKSSNTYVYISNVVSNDITARTTLKLTKTRLRDALDNIVVSLLNKID